MLWSKHPSGRAGAIRPLSRRTKYPICGPFWRDQVDSKFRAETRRLRIDLPQSPPPPPALFQVRPRLASCRCGARSAEKLPRPGQPQGGGQKHPRGGGGAGRRSGLHEPRGVQRGSPFWTVLGARFFCFGVFSFLFSFVFPLFSSFFCSSFFSLSVLGSVFGCFFECVQVVWCCYLVFGCLFGFFSRFFFFERVFLLIGFRLVLGVPLIGCRFCSFLVGFKNKVLTV